MHASHRRKLGGAQPARTPATPTHKHRENLTGGRTASASPKDYGVCTGRSYDSTPGGVVSWVAAPTPPICEPKVAAFHLKAELFIRARMSFLI